MIDSKYLKSNPNMIENLKHNWFFPISAFCFFALNSWNLVYYLIGIIIAFFIVLWVSLHYGKISDIYNKSSLPIRVFSLINSVGICIFDHDLFYKIWAERALYDTSSPIPFPSLALANIIGIIGSIIAFYFVFISLLYFNKKLFDVFKDYALFKDIKSSELVFYIILCLLTFVFVTYAFLNSQLFYKTEYIANVLYTSDSPMIVQLNAYLDLTHMENDLRQPLFAVFSSPLMGFTYLLGYPFSDTGRAIIMDYAQVIILVIANFLLAKLLGLSGYKRIVFVSLISSTYSYLLFSIMMEQYIIAYFYLILCLYIHTNSNSFDLFLLFAASSTLLTGSIIIPFVLWRKYSGNFLLWVKNLFKIIGKFLILILAFGRFDVFYTLIEKIIFLSSFSGNRVSLPDRILQYFVFVRSYFITPINEVYIYPSGDIKWRLCQIDSLDVVGVIIFALAFLSFILNRKKTNSCIYISWVLFSVFILVIMGWGTSENGLTLYILYFGWAFISLLYQLLELVEEKFHIRHFAPIVCSCLIVLFLIINLTEMSVLLDFAFTIFPV